MRDKLLNILKRDIPVTWEEKETWTFQEVLEYFTKEINSLDDFDILNSYFFKIREIKKLISLYDVNIDNSDPEYFSKKLDKDGFGDEILKWLFHKKIFDDYFVKNKLTSKIEDINIPKALKTEPIEICDEIDKPIHESAGSRKTDEIKATDSGKPINKGGRPKGIKSQKIAERNKFIRNKEKYWRDKGLRGNALYTQLKSEVQKKGHELAISSIRDICKFRNE